MITSRHSYLVTVVLIGAARASVWMVQSLYNYVTDVHCNIDVVDVCFDVICFVLCRASLCLSVSLSLCVPVCLYLSVSVFLSLTLFFSFFPLLFLSVSVSLHPYPHLCVCVCVCVCV